MRSCFDNKVSGRTGISKIRVGTRTGGQHALPFAQQHVQLCRNLIIRVAISSRSVITSRDVRNVRARAACDAINTM